MFVASLIERTSLSIGAEKPVTIGSDCQKYRERYSLHVNQRYFRQEQPFPMMAGQEDDPPPIIITSAIGAGIALLLFGPPAMPFGAALLLIIGALLRSGDCEDDRDKRIAALEHRVKELENESSD